MRPSRAGTWKRCATCRKKKILARFLSPRGGVCRSCRESKRCSSCHCTKPREMFRRENGGTSLHRVCADCRHRAASVASAESSGSLNGSERASLDRNLSALRERLAARVRVVHLS